MKRFLVLLMIVFFAFAQSAFAEKDTQYFIVTADAEVKVKPNRVTITFGINDRDENLPKGKERMNFAIKKAIAYCLNKGVQEKNIQTEFIQITPVYPEATKSVQPKRYYQLSQYFSVTLEDPAKYDDIIFNVLDQGINVVENINFYTTDLKKYKDQTRVDAVKNAQEKAKLLSEAAGLRIKAVNMSEQTNDFYPVPRMAMNAMSKNMYAADAESVPAGTGMGMISVKSTISITYEVLQ